MQTVATETGMWSIDNNDLLTLRLPMDEGLHQRLPEKLGLGHSKIFRLEHDLSYIQTHFSPHRDLAILSRVDHQEPRMVVTLGLQGASRFVPNRGGTIEFREGYTSITTFNGSEGSRQYRGNQSVTQLRLTMSKSWLERNFGERPFSPYFDDSAMNLVSHRPISAAGLAAAHALVNGNVAVMARPLFRKAQALAILASELGQLLSGTRQPAGRFNPRDETIATRARDILLSEYKAPPSVETLAKRVGTNAFKLKQLFHQFFDDTPYGVLLDFRMKHAYQLLQAGHCSIAMAAEAVGYNHASNFSTAFSKYFGFPPKRLARRE